MGQDDPVLIGTVTKVTDGDTIKVKLDSGPITVRFGSIDAPESNQPWGHEANAALAQLLDGQEVSLTVVTQDRYERLVAIVHLGDENINAWMVQQGHAWAYRQYLEDAEFCVWEGSARAAKRGLWSLPVEEWRAPWEWRSWMRRGIKPVINSADETVTSCIAAMRRAAVKTRPATTFSTKRAATEQSGHCFIKGNISDRVHIYHVPGSSSYTRTRIDESKGERWFCTEEEARAAGWIPPKN